MCDSNEKSGVCPISPLLNHILVSCFDCGRRKAVTELKLFLSVNHDSLILYSSRPSGPWSVRNWLVSGFCVDTVDGTRVNLALVVMLRSRPCCVDMMESGDEYESGGNEKKRQSYSDNSLSETYFWQDVHCIEHHDMRNYSRGGWEWSCEWVRWCCRRSEFHWSATFLYRDGTTNPLFGARGWLWPEVIVTLTPFKAYRLLYRPLYPVLPVDAFSLLFVVDEIRNVPNIWVLWGFQAVVCSLMYPAWVSMFTKQYYCLHPLQRKDCTSSRQ